MKKAYYLIIFICLAAGSIFIWYRLALASRSDSNEDAYFKVEEGESTAAIAERLEDNNLIDSSLAFKIYYYFNSQAKIQAGEYIIPAHTRTTDVIRYFGQGDIAGREVNVLIREGLNVREINQYLKEQGYLKDDSFLNEAKKYEGYLFPDTYRMYKGFSAKDLIDKMRANFEKKLTQDLRDAMNKSGHSPEDILIMASILEKEVRTEEDMKIVSGIFWHRIKIGQGLQSDATLSYVLDSGKAAHSYEETQTDSLYNTYKYRGLPPGPITNPGLQAIRAAIYPIDTEYNYFLSRPDNGETVFSRTLDEHNAAKAKYLK